jgi:hypothetical protein
MNPQVGTSVEGYKVRCYGKITLTATGLVSHLKCTHPSGTRPRLPPSSNLINRWAGSLAVNSA